ncbi:MAG: TonB-dependent receptor [Bacteroidota bacterium]
MKRFLFLIFFSAVFGSVFSQEQEYNQTVRGSVYDKDSKTPLWGVNIVIEETSPLLGTSTDSSGNFKIPAVPVGRHTFKVTYLGYQDIVLPEILISTGKEMVLNFEMQEKISNMKELTVKGNRNKDLPLNTMATVSARSFNVEETGRYAACINDPARMVQSFAGVASNGDESNEIIIRGNSPRGLLWRLEGIEIPNPNHFSNGEGDSGGGVSMISNNLLASSDFFTGAFPAEYGNALSGVFDINMRKGNTGKHEYALQLGVLGMEAALEGPFSKKNKSSYLFSYRYSTLDFLYSIGVKVAGNIVPKYQDMQFNLYFPAKKTGKFNVWGLAGLSSLGNTPYEDSTNWKKHSDKLHYNQVQRTGVIGLGHVFPFGNNKTYLKSTVALSSERNAFIEDTLDNNYNYRPVYRDTFDYFISRISVMVNHKLNSSNVFRAGVIYGNYNYNLTVKSTDSDSGAFVYYLNSKGNTALAQAFVQWQHRPNEDITVNAGAHSMFFLLNEDAVFEPRCGVRWQFNALMALNAGVGLHSRIESISNYMAEEIQTDGSSVKPNLDIKFTKAFHAVLGYDYLMREDMRLKAEIYYQYLFDVPVQDTASVFSAVNYVGGFTNTPMANSGYGRNYGIETTVEKFFTKNYYFLATASLFESRYCGSDGMWRNTFFNNNYIFNFLGGKEFPVGKRKNNIFNINIRMIRKGGNRLVPIDLQKSIAHNHTVYIDSLAYEEKAPDYIRIDAGLSYRKNNKNYSWIISLDVENVLNRMNVYSRYFDKETKQIENNYNLGILPILSFKIEF